MWRINHGWGKRKEEEEEEYYFMITLLIIIIMPYSWPVIYIVFIKCSAFEADLDLLNLISAS